MRPGEAIVFDLFAGKQIFTTELLDSPLKKGGNKKIHEWNKIYLGVLNSIDLIISKMFRGDQVDREDCLTLAKNEDIDIKRLEKRYRETAQYEAQQEKVLKNLDLLLKDFREHRILKGGKNN